MSTGPERAKLALDKYVEAASVQDISSEDVTKLILRATSDPETFFFYELCNVPSVNALQQTEDAPYYEHLKIFSYGTYQDYLQHISTLPPLNDVQRHKLRQLSILTLAQDQDNLNYPNLLTALDLESTDDLEEVISSAVFAELMDASMDTLRQTLDIHSVNPMRDINPTDIIPIQQLFASLVARCDQAISLLDNEIASTNKPPAIPEPDAATLKQLYGESMKPPNEMMDALSTALPAIEAGIPVSTYIEATTQPQAMAAISDAFSRGGPPIGMSMAGYSRAAAKRGQATFAEEIDDDGYDSSGNGETPEANMRPRRRKR